jgi:S-DNA-T family DNA segregation ATPase FtsK/SpoIIIE
MNLANDDITEITEEELQGKIYRGPIIQEVKTEFHKKRPEVVEEAEHEEKTEYEEASVIENTGTGIDESHYLYPPKTFLSKGSAKKTGKNTASLHETANKLQEILQNFGVNVTVTNVSQGPSVTRYELQPEMGTKVSRITSLADDIKLNLAASDIRI